MLKESAEQKKGAARIPPRARGILKARAPRSYIAKQLILPAEAYIHNEVVGGISLIAAALVALLAANSPWSASYFQLRETILTLDFGFYRLSMDFQHWVNDGLMAIFFFVVALEIKSEIMRGQLSQLKKAAMPVAGAFGGMIVPAAIYLLFNPTGSASRGWGIPLATDIAFALGIFALLGNRVSANTRMLLLAMAVVDDIGGIIVIGAFYSGNISFSALGYAGAGLLMMFLLHLGRLRSIVVYAAVGIFVWAAMMKSGINASLTGVILGLLTPAKPWYALHSFAENLERLLAQFRKAVADDDRDRADAALGEIEELADQTEAPVDRLQREFHPWVSYVILPVFAFTNAGTDFYIAAVRNSIHSPVMIGIFAGLVLGKSVGIYLFCRLAALLGIASLPKNVTWSQLFGVGLLGGIGFTVSLFILNLAFVDRQLVADGKLGIYAASLVSSVAGYLYLRSKS